MEEKTNNLFYCYSIKLKDWLKLNGLYFTRKGTHPNGNFFWCFERNENLDRALINWDKYKKIFK